MAPNEAERWLSIQHGARDAPPETDAILVKAYKMWNLCVRLKFKEDMALHLHDNYRTVEKLLKEKGDEEGAEKAASEAFRRLKQSLAAGKRIEYVEAQKKKMFELPRTKVLFKEYADELKSQMPYLAPDGGEEEEEDEETQCEDGAIDEPDANFIECLDLETEHVLQQLKQLQSASTQVLARISLLRNKEPLVIGELD